MRKELDDKLVKTFPHIFRDRYASVKETPMGWGFCCGDGWYWLIYNLCAALQRGVDVQADPQMVAAQVKEKFGTLRFYVIGATEEQFATIALAEFLSGSICELCGTTNDAKQTQDGWVKTLCNKCRKDKNGKTQET